MNAYTAQEDATDGQTKRNLGLICATDFEAVEMTAEEAFRTKAAFLLYRVPKARRGEARFVQRVTWRDLIPF